METIKNKFLSISVKNHGAELCSLKSLQNKKEYLWQANPKYWGKHAPILFPFVGRLKDGEFTFNGKSYKMTKHGFARDFDFQLLKKEDKRLEYFLKSSERTLEMYPFNFELYVIYELKDKKLNTIYKVKNNDTKAMYFSIGAHPAFNCNIAEGDKYIEFEYEETLYSYIVNLDNGLIKNKRKAITENKKRFLLTYDLFEEDALVFDEIRSASVCITDNKTNEKVKVTIKGFPYLGIWTPKAPFLCIEPWYGIADMVDSNKRLEDKKGIQILDVGKTFECNYEIEIVN
ncbi:aldose 1-epimerase family protein [Paramaledivibacter caminithermalis]|uniref:Galactose mutarotase n=1 Tax=Paramaledivibacter caminithermalis (strain DSM 15212 / CIP 107654 / DViRD3) TaxID=1121301 RepID=A0A1M6K6H3_PARC5|nr:aldose 1-epimerase family protein [Paramaledivibacter caminithermalis]SHJ54606.1 Galactose mutarotase [Paramaledivibacter caminithermalis DSM 15212]